MALLIHPRAPNSSHFHLYISMFLHDLPILPQKDSCHTLIRNPYIQTNLKEIDVDVTNWMEIEVTGNHCKISIEFTCSTNH